METTLIFSEIIFYLTVSVAIIVIGALCAIAAYHLMRVARNLNSASNEAGERINDIIDRVSDFPILSFLKKHPAARGGPSNGGAGKGRARIFKKQAK